MSHYASPLREGGPFAKESHSLLKGENLRPSRVVTVYADDDKPSHCVRLWYDREEPGARSLDSRV